MWVFTGTNQGTGCITNLNRLEYEATKVLLPGDFLKRVFFQKNATKGAYPEGIVRLYGIIRIQLSESKASYIAIH